MKKVTASLLLLFPLLLLGQISPKMNYNIGSASTQFGANLSAGSDVYDAGTKKKYTITESVSSTGTLNATINKIEWSPSTHTHANMVSISGATASGYIPIFSSGTTITSSDLSLTGRLITTGYNFLINGTEETNFQINDVPDGITVFKVSSEDDKISFFDNSFSYTYHGIGTESLYGVLGITGLVGIGTTSPATGYQLDVVGNINTAQTVNQNTYPSVNASQTAATLQDGSSYTGTDITMSTKYIATKIVASGNHTMGDYYIRIKASATLTNPTNTIRGYLYSDNSGVPGTNLASGNLIRFGTLTTSYQSLSVGTSYTLAQGTTYWLVLMYDATPTGGDIILDGATLTGSGATSTGSVWTATDNVFRYLLRGKTSYGVSGNSTNSIGVYGNSTNFYGVYGSSTNYIGVSGNSTNYTGVSGSSTNSYGVYGSSTNHIGVYGSSTNYTGIYGVSTNYTGIYGSSTNSYGGTFYINGALSKNNSSNTVLIRRYPSGSYNVTGNILQIIDNPTSTGTISGSLISGQIDATTRLDFNPRVVDGASAVAYFSDTKNALSTTGAKLWSFRNSGVEKASIDHSGGASFATIGIGVSASSVPLHIYSNSEAARLGDGTNTNTYVTIASDGSSNRAMIGYHKDNAVLQGGSAKGIKFCVDNNTFGSGVVASFETSGYLGLGVTSGIDSRITLATHTTAAGGIRFGPDVTLYRDSNHNLKSDDTLHVEGLIIGASHFTTLATSHGSHDRTITFPDSSGRVALLSNIPTDYVNLDSNQIISGVKTFSNGSLKLFNDTGEGATVLKTATGDGMTASISLPGASGTLIKAQNGGVENYVPRFTATGEYDIDTSGIKIVGEDAEIPGTLKLGKSGSSYKLPDTCGNDDQIMASTGNDGELAWVNPGSLINFIEPKFSLLIDSLMINETAKYPIGYSQGVEIDSVIIVVTSTAGVDQRVGVKFYYGPDMSAAGTTVNTNSNLSAEGYINKAARYGGSTLTNKTVPKGNIIWLKIILDSPKKPRMIHYTIVGHRS